ncbi:MAG: hypothetical protein ACI9EQ_000372 [Bacteroidia bacterium]|jgi:hypothetical protein
MIKESQLTSKLDEFINRFYKNQLMKGSMFFVALWASYFLFIALAEHFGHFGTAVRTAFFYSFIVIGLVAFSRWVLFPTLKLIGVSKRLSYHEAAIMIGGHFKEVEDRLLNTLQLLSSAQINPETQVLLEASIDQKMEGMNAVPFVRAVDFTENKRFLKYAVPPVVVLILMIVVFPSLMKESTQRLVAHSNTFEEVAPFSFSLRNAGVSAIQNEDLELVVDIQGTEVPAEVYIDLPEGRFRMHSSADGGFQYTIRQIQEETSIRFYGGGFSSETFEINVIPRPIVNGFSVELDYPGYLGKQDEVLSNAGDLLVPAGTVVKWLFDTRHTEHLGVSFPDTLLNASRQGENSYLLAKRLYGSSEYTVISSDPKSGLKDSIQYSITVVPDLYPTINVEEVKDTNSLSRLYFNGFANDDHGLSRLEFHYSIGAGSNESSEELSLENGRNNTEFFHSWNMGQLSLEPGTEVTYYFQVWDNDGVNGAKSSKTKILSYKIPTQEELSDKAEKDNEEIKEDLQKAIDEAKKIREDLENMKRDLLEKEQPDWGDKEQFKELLQRQKDLQNMVESVKENNEKKNKQQNEFSQVEERVVEKQQQLEKLFEDIMSEEMKELFKKMEEMMEEMNKDKAQEMLEDMEFSNEDLEKELDRSLELFKQMEYEQKLEETKEKLEKLAEEQEKLSEESESGEKDSDELKKEQEKLNEKFEDIKEDIEDLEKKNSELEKPNDMEDMKEEQEEVDENQEESQEELEKDQKKKASKSQKDASDKMEEMAKKMGNMMMSMESQGQEEDLDALRQIVENLLTLSFDQESVIDELKGIKRNDPKYVDITREQKKLNQDTKIIEDSLYALSKRVVQIETVVNREIRAVNKNMKKSMSLMADRKTPQALTRQQLALTSVNNLALLLSEVIDQMQQQMQSMMSGSGTCSKPGSGKKPSAGGMKKMQEKLNAQMEKMKKAMEKGKKPGPKPGQGQKPGKGGMGMSKELAKMAAQQEALRSMVQEYENSLKNKPGSKGSGGDMKDLSKLMEQTENDLVNKQLTLETLRRQEEIMTRLLEAEKAEREREKEERRESVEAKDQKEGNPEEYFQYKQRKKKETELLRTVPPNLTPFYRSKVDDYFSSPTE